MPKRAMTGGCQCGNIRYEVNGEALALFVCHCRECQKQSSSAFGISVIVRASDVTLVSGALEQWSRPATVSGSMVCAICPCCGSRIWHGDAEHDEVISVKGGSLDSPPDLARATHIWTSSKLEGVIIPDGTEAYPEEPPF
jgi:hypothetical protein